MPKECDVNRPVILSVDDTPANLVAMDSLLAGLEVEILRASSGQETLEIALARSELAVILLDVQMPGMSGFETAEMLRMSESTQGIPIIFVTGAKDEGKHIFQGYESGAVDYLIKPLSKHILRSKVRVFLELARQRDKLIRAQAELERSNQALLDFAFAAAHDLKAPLRHVRAWVGLLRDRNAEELSEDANEKLAHIDAATERMNNLILSLLSYAELNASPPLMSVIDMNRVLEDVCADLEEAIDAAKARVVVGPLPKVQGNALLLYQLFQNLIANAIKYRDKERSLRIDIQGTCDTATGQCKIAVGDTGMGFAPEMIEELFKPFRRLVPESHSEGSGLGLSTVRKIVETHGGGIEADGTRGGGAIFTMTLPLAAGRLNLLIVDSDDRAADELRGRLVEQGLNISHVKSAKAALPMVARGDVDVVLADYLLPVQDGLSLLEQVAKNHPHVRRVLMSLGDSPESEAGVVQLFWSKLSSVDSLEPILSSSADSSYPRENR